MAIICNFLALHPVTRPAQQDRDLRRAPVFIINQKSKVMKTIYTENSELLEVLAANGVNIICNDQMEMVISDIDAIRIDEIVSKCAPAAFADYVVA